MRCRGTLRLSRAMTTSSQPGWCEYRRSGVSVARNQNFGRNNRSRNSATYQIIHPIECGPVDPSERASCIAWANTSCASCGMPPNWLSNLPQQTRTGRVIIVQNRLQKLFVRLKTQPVGDGVFEMMRFIDDQNRGMAAKSGCRLRHWRARVNG